MYAIVEIAGQQFKVEKEQQIFVHRLQGDEGSSVEFDQVLLLDNAGKVIVGTPTVSGALIKAKIIDHLRGDKVLVFHKKRRKGYQKENGHRQYFSKVLIEDILTDVKKAPAAAEAPEAKVEKKKVPVAETEMKEVKEVKKATPAKKKKTTPKAEKKEAPAAKKEVKPEKGTPEE